MSLTPSASNSSVRGPSSDTSNDGKTKQRRRRQRLSCVECTKRRQKCDRQLPCGLCISRGKEDLCRWEPIVARPTPQRPPEIDLRGQPSAKANATIEALQARIAALEKRLLGEDLKESPNRSDEEQDQEPIENQVTSLPLLDYDEQVAAVSLAQLSLAPRAEFVGSGTVLCALHELGSPDRWRYPYPQSGLMTTNHLSTIPQLGPPHPVISPIRSLIYQLPSPSRVNELLDSFFATTNLEVGLSQTWFRAACDQMWLRLSLQCIPGCPSRGSCHACHEEVNPHWLSLLFAVLASSPASGQNAMHYANNSLVAKRIVDDTLLSLPAYSTSEGSVDGGVFGCLAIVFLSYYFSERGRVSEAWKLCGNAIRNAQALGLHRDPKWQKWEAMGPLEADLRMGTWWLLVVSDRVFSFILGRPPMSIKGTFETIPVPTDTYGDGSPNPHASFQRQFVFLSDLICEASISCTGLTEPTLDSVIEMDRKFQTWEEQLPSELRWRTTPQSSSPQTCGVDDNDQKSTTTYCARSLRTQRVVLAIWYLDTLMGIHRPYMMHPPPRSPSKSDVLQQSRVNPFRERCIKLAIELTDILCKHYRDISTQPPAEQVLPSMFSYILFDGAVALAGALSQVPPHPQASHCLDLIDDAMLCLRKIAERYKDTSNGEAETAIRALTVLAALRRAGGFGSNGGEQADCLYRHQQEGEMYFVSEPVTFGPLPSRAGEIPQLSMSSYSNTSSLRDSPYLAATPLTEISGIPGIVGADLFPPQNNSKEGSNFTGRLQAPLNPYEVLQGVQLPLDQEIAAFDIDWARLAGMESWNIDGTSHAMS